MKKISLFTIFMILISCSNDNFDDVIVKKKSLNAVKIEESKIYSINPDIITNDKLKIKKFIPLPVLVCEPNHYDIFTPISTITESSYTAINGFNGLTFVGDALQDTFLLPNGNATAIENDDILVIGSEITPLGWEEATSGITPFAFKYNDIPQTDIFGNKIWNWIYSEDGVTLSATNVTDVYLSAYDRIQDEINSNTNYTSVNKLMIGVDFEFSGAITINFFIWFS